MNAAQVSALKLAKRLVAHFLNGRMPKTNIVREIERSLGEKLPENIGRILIETGFNSKTAIKKLKDIASIRSIEKYVQEKREDFRDLLKNTVYANIEIFEFRAGHVTFLQSLPEQIAKIDENKQRKRPAKRLYSAIDDSKQPSAGELSITFEPPTCELAKDQDELIEKIKKFAEEKNIAIGDFGESNVLNLRIQNSEPKCSIQCPLCTRKVPCTKKKYWGYGHFTDHLKTHISSTSTDETIFVNNIIEQKSQSEPENKIQIIKSIVVTEEELNQLLNFEVQSLNDQ